MKKFVCSVCGYVHEGEAAPAECPICHAPAEKFKEQSGEKTWAAEHLSLIHISNRCDSRARIGMSGAEMSPNMAICNICCTQ